MNPNYFFPTIACALMIAVPAVGLAEGVAEAAKEPAASGAIFAAYPTKKVAPHTYVVHGATERPMASNKGFMNNPGFVVTNTGVVVIDPGSSVQIGRELVTRIREVTDKPITHAFTSHVHGDHWLGNQALVEANPEIKIYAHPKMIEEAQAGKAEEWIDLMENLTEGATKGTVAKIPTERLKDGEEIRVGGLTFRAWLSDVAHTHTDAMIEVVEDGVLFTGDNVTWKRMPRMDDGSFRGNVATIERAMRMDNIKVVVPGHGMTGGKDILSPYHDYLDTVYSEARTLMEEGLEDFEMKDKVRQKVGAFADWSGFDKELGRHISLSVLEAEQAEFE
ncbi:MAG: MBL fold metallo-hydrolase [bacterium]